ncbi:MAG: short-chain dehydrogenase [Sulfurimonas sp.]|nr:MAG: short-chain dehydrogenase [Sulfurimonas sp.]
MKTAVVTGASSGIGKAIALRLLELEYRVIGISRRRCDITHPHFKTLQCDLCNIQETTALGVKLQQEMQICILVNAAGFGVFQPHEELHPSTIEAMLHVNLTAPILLCNMLLKTLKKHAGHIINITSIEATRSSKFSALYTASKSGLRAFGNALFEELRKHDVSVVTINPDMTDTPFFDALNFETASEPASRLQSSDIADALEQILSMRQGVVVTEITLRSQRFGIRKKTMK